MSHPSNAAVFLSYASQDAEAAKRICESLQAAGIEVWFDQSGLKGGAAWDAEIRRQIRDCALFVPIISANTESRLEGYFRLEWRLAEQRSHLMARGRPFLVPVVIDDTPDDDAQVPDAFVDVQWTRLPGGEGAAAFARHIHALLMPVEPKPDEAHATTSVHAHSLGATASLRRPASPQRRTVNWPAFAAIATLVGVIAGGLWYFSRGNELGTAGRESAIAGQTANPIPDKSIAVLPFENLSSSADDGYLADGIADTLLQMLSQQRELKVIARTSSFSFRSSKEDVRAIGQKLGVATLLEGSIQHAGDRLRVIVQLVSTRDGRNLWSQTYDRMMADVFTVQDEIATNVAGSLSVSLAGNGNGNGAAAAKPRHTPTVEAYQEYLRGRQQLAIYNRDAIAEATDHFRKAIELDANYALPHVGLVLALRAQQQAGHPEVLNEAVAAIQRAITLDPASAEAWTGLGWVRAMLGDVVGEEEAFRRAIELSPGLADPYQGLAGLLVIRNGDDLSEARILVDKALALDPLRAGLQRERLMVAAGEGRIDEAEKAGKRWIALSPRGYDGYMFTSNVYAVKGELDEAVRYLRRAGQLGGNPPSIGWWIAGFLRALGDVTSAAQLESRLPDVPDPGLSRAAAMGLVQQADAQILKGDVAAAEHTLRRTRAVLPGIAERLARIELRSNKPRDALARLKAVAPALGAPEPVVELNTVTLVPALAIAYQSAGQADRAGRLLAAAEAYLRPRPIVIGTVGGSTTAAVLLLHARVFALEGKRAEALAALRTGVDAGIGYAWQLWSVEEDFASIRDAPEFKACIEIAKARNAKQLESLRRQPELPAT